MDKSHFIETAYACLANGKRLLDDADRLNYGDHPGTSLALATVAQEEFAKAFLMFLVSRDVIVWNGLIYRATRDHTCKQLLGLVMSYMNPDTDEFLKRMDESHTATEERKRLLEAYKNCPNTIERDKIWERILDIGEKQDALPRSVADAINIFRHEKIRRWESLRWAWAEEPVYDEIARRIGEGQQDREKQDALYVRIARNGQHAKTPDEAKSEDATLAMENGKRLGSLIERLLSGDTRGVFEYEKIESAFKVVFASLSEAD